MKNHHKLEYKNMRSVVLWLYEFRCMFNNCGNAAEHVHHVNKNSADNSIYNLIPLCQNCHRLVHICNANFSIRSKQIIVLLLKKIAYYSS